MEIINEILKERIFDAAENYLYFKTEVLSNITEISKEYYLTDENIYYIVETCFDRNMFCINEIIYSIDMSNKMRSFQFLLPLIKKYFDGVFGSVYTSIYTNYQFGEDFLDQHSGSINKRGWGAISRYQKLSKKFIYKYADKLDMDLIKNYNPYCKDLFN